MRFFCIWSQHGSGLDTISALDALACYAVTDSSAFLLQGVEGHQVVQRGLSVYGPLWEVNVSATQATASALAEIPEPSARNIAIRVVPAAERALREGHPWLFAGSIREQSHEGAPGDLAVVFDRKGRFLAVGLYDPHSLIRVRVLQYGEPAPIEREWFARRLAAAAARRAPLHDRPAAGRTTGYRLVHGENDGLPGFVVDQYGQTLVIKLYTAAWMPHLQDVLAPLTEIVPAERLVLRLGRAMQERPQYLYGLEDGVILSGPSLDGPVLFWENGLRFEADPIRGHKTGFYLDQRENRARVEPLAGGKDVLNVFPTQAPSPSTLHGVGRGPSLTSTPARQLWRPRSAAWPTIVTSRPWRRLSMKRWWTMLSRLWREWENQAVASTW